MKPKQRSVVTGGAGFLGSHLVDALLGEGHLVVALDNLLTGSAENLQHLRNESRLEVQQRDVCEPFDVGRVDCIFHFASPASPADYSQYGPETLRVNSVGTLNAIDVARKYQATLLLASTSECYGDPQEHPQKESYWGHVNPVGPRSVYDEGKRFAEAAVMAAFRYYKLDIRIARIFNTYGPRMHVNDGRVIPNFMKQALRGDDLTIYGDGTQTRSFCYVSDEIEGLMRLARAREPEPVNIGNPTEFSVLECAQKVLKVTGSRSGMQFGDLPEDDPQQRQPDISKARTLLGWEPKIDLETGLKLSLDYFRTALHAETTKAAV
jgi:dTDP-glucose 4,6-dehydratase